MEVYGKNIEFNNLNFTIEPLLKGEYESCTFLGCNFLSSDLSKIIFSEYEFVDCNLSMVNFSNTALRNVKFKGCKMLGINFEDCNEFGHDILFENCVIDHCLFYQVKMTHTDFMLE